MYFFTSVNTYYLPKARLLAQTLKEHNEGSFFILVLSDNLPADFDIEHEPFDAVILGEELSYIDNKNIFFFCHNVTELCTAVKPAAALEIMDKYHADKVCYLDPDIAVFSSFYELEALLDNYSMVFTPHTIEPEDQDNYVVGNEILFLKRGCNNLGFFAVKNDDEGRKFLLWWHKRLSLFCLDDNYQLLPLLEEQGLLGVFTDQKWIDLVPSFFDKYYILKHPGYNVSTWNLSHRYIKKETDGTYSVNDKPLVFFHFSGVDSGAHRIVLEQLIQQYPTAKGALPLSDWYLSKQNEYRQGIDKDYEWKYSRYSTGQLILNEHRKIMLIRRDTHAYFQNPFVIDDGFCYYNWMMNEYGSLLNKPEPVNANESAAVEADTDKSTIVLWLKKIVKLLIPKNTKLYFKCKMIWKALCS